MPTALTSKSSNGIAAAAVVGGLGGGVDDQVRAEILNQRKDAFAVPDVECLVPIFRNFVAQPPQTPASIASGPKNTAR